MLHNYFLFWETLNTSSKTLCAAHVLGRTRSPHVPTLGTRAPLSMTKLSTQDNSKYQVVPGVEIISHASWHVYHPEHSDIAWLKVTLVDKEQFFCFLGLKLGGIKMCKVSIIYIYRFAPLSYYYLDTLPFKKVYRNLHNA